MRSDDGFQKWLQNLPADFLAHLWEFYQEEETNLKPIGRVILFDGTNEPLYGSTRETKKAMTETDVFNHCLDLGLSTEQALKILQWKPRDTRN